MNYWACLYYWDKKYFQIRIRLFNKKTYEKDINDFDSGGWF